MVTTRDATLPFTLLYSSCDVTFDNNLTVNLFQNVLADFAHISIRFSLS